MSTSYYIGIDPATTNSGIAVLDSSGSLIAHRLITVAKPRDAFQRIPLMTQQIEAALLPHLKQNTSAIVEYTREGTHGVDILVKIDILVGSIWNMLLSHGCKVKLMLPSEWRSRVSPEILKGGKNVKRDELKLRAQNIIKEKFHITPSIDEAEAICIACAGLE